MIGFFSDLFFLWKPGPATVANVSLMLLVKIIGSFTYKVPNIVHATLLKH